MPTTFRHIVNLCFVLASSLLLLLFVPFDSAYVATMLISSACVCAFELIRHPWRGAIWVVFVALGFVFPTVALFLPLAIYDAVREMVDERAFGFDWQLHRDKAYAAEHLRNFESDSTRISVLSVITLALVFVLFVFLVVVQALPPGAFWLLGALGMLSAVLSVSTTQTIAFASKQLALRDALRESSLRLAERNRNLKERQDYEVDVARMAERGRIARDIHDNVGHLLTRGVLQVDAALAVHGSDAAFGSDLVAIKTTIQEALASVRESVHALHEDSLDLRGRIEGALEALEGRRVTTEIVFESAPPVIALCLLAVLREAVSNINHHSDATEVSVRLIEFPGLYTLQVSDNGCEASQTSQRSNERRGVGMGLHSIEERVINLGGTLRTSVDDRGFSLLVTLPKPNEEVAS